MERLSGLTKFLGIPSLATVALGGGLLWYSGNAENRYHNFIEESSRTVPIVRQVDGLDNALGDLFDSEKALTHYIVKPMTVISTGKTTIVQPAIYHNPDINESLGELKSARSNIARGNFSDNYEVRTLDGQIRIMQDGLGRVERGKLEQFYEPQRTEIQGLQKRGSSELDLLKKEVPSDILGKRESLINQTKGSLTAGLILGISGLIGAAFYGLIKATDR